MVQFCIVFTIGIYKVKLYYVTFQMDLCGRSLMIGVPGTNEVEFRNNLFACCNETPLILFTKKCCVWLSVKIMGKLDPIKKVYRQSQRQGQI